MTHALTAIRILSSLGSIWAYLAFRKELRKQDEIHDRRVASQRLGEVIRGGK